MDTILIEALEFYGYHGASDEEQNVGHRYSVDIELRCDLRPAGASDHLHDTVNYSKVARRVIAVATSEQYRLLEALAERLAAVILAEFEVESVRLRVRKVRPPMNAIAAAVGVEIERRRAV